jgi:hypothetical protein
VTEFTLPCVLVRFDGYDKDVKALLGTNAASMVSEAVVNSDLIDTSRNREYRLSPTMGGLTEIVGFIQLQVEIGRYLYQHEFVVVPSSFAFEMTLGADFLSSYAASMNFRDCTISFGNDKVPLLDRFYTNCVILSAQLVRVAQPPVKTSRKNAGSHLGPPGRRRY